MALGMEVGLGPGHSVLDGDTVPLPKRGQSPPNFRPIFIVAKWLGIKMPLYMEVDLSPGDFVLDRDPAPYPKRGGAPNFRPTSIVAKRLHGSRCHLYGGRSRATRHCVRCGPSYPTKKAHPSPPQFLARLLWPSGWMDEDAS